jgi:hypothetical protein
MPCGTSLMIARDQENYMHQLEKAFFDQTAPESIPRRNAHFFSAAKRAVVVRIITLDRIVTSFEKLGPKVARTFENRLEEDILLYGFFMNALSVIDSFCFGAYFVGTQLSSKDFNPNPNLRSIDPKHTGDYFSKFSPTSAFTTTLSNLLQSPEYEKLDIRNVLAHRIIPGRTLSLTNVPGRYLPDSWNLDQWLQGDWSNAGPGVGNPPPKKELLLEPIGLVNMRDWLAERFQLLGKELTLLATKHGLT